MASANKINLHALVDKRDESELETALSEEALSRFVKLHPVPVPRWVGDHHVHAKTRMGYLAWRRPCLTLLSRLAADGPLDIVHQVTFASGTLPPALPRSARRTIWGPIAVPSSRGPIFSLARAAAKTFAAQADLVIANNERSFDFLYRSGADGQTHGNVAFEPNVVVPHHSISEAKVRNRVAIAGVLEARKRPWIAIQAMATPQLAAAHLIVIGDGPLRSRLEDFTFKMGLQNRVEFVGRVPREDALKLIASSSALAHPSSREGSPWVIGEAASVGTPSIAYEGSGADSMVRASDIGGAIVPSDASPETFARAVHDVLTAPQPEPTRRWDRSRLVPLLTEWWGLGSSGGGK
ncbi:glycosyltransferase [Microbacterium sp. GXF7504]